MIFALLLACTNDKEPSIPLFDGPFSYSSQYDDQWYIDTLWMVTEEAEAEIAQQGETPRRILGLAHRCHERHPVTKPRR